MTEEANTDATSETQTTTETEAPRNEDKQLGEAGEKALEAFKTRAKDAERQSKELAEKVKEFEDRDKSELEKLTGKIESLSEKNAQFEAENLRLRIAGNKQLPTELIDRLKGSTQEEIEADADELLKLVKTDTPTSMDGGAREPAPEPKTPAEAHNELLLGALGINKS